MSGGVDSAVSASLLQEQGFDVHGIFMKNWDEDDGTEFCTAVVDYEDAKQVADHLDIPLHPINFASEYWDAVFEDFLLEYRAGRTPNPDVLCNKNIKFAVFKDYAESRGFDLIATGHYAKLVKTNGSIELHRALDLEKDQTYFLQSVPIERLNNCMFPLSDMSKTAVREYAKKRGLHVFAKKDSTGICFIGERRFAEFLNRYVPQEPGPIKDMNGQRVGEHIGLPFYTLGQRQGLGIGGRQDAKEAPWYVQSKHIDGNTLIVTQSTSDLVSSTLIATNLNLLCTDIRDVEHISGMIRYRAEPQPCHVEFEGERLRVRFDEPQRAITPGQYIAFYQESQCLGGAKIETVTE